MLPVLLRLRFCWMIVLNDTAIVLTPTRAKRFQASNSIAEGSATNRGLGSHRVVVRLDSNGHALVLGIHMEAKRDGMNRSAIARHDCDRRERCPLRDEVPRDRARRGRGPTLACNGAEADEGCNSHPRGGSSDRRGLRCITLQ